LTHPDPVMLPAGSIEKLRHHAGYTRWSVDGQFHLSHKQIGRHRAKCKDDRDAKHVHWPIAPPQETVSMRLEAK
jgi:hypothetical protein